jgi:all-trans-8'-apo-beta-carotenal 15,15'-oxygenase
LIGGQDYGHYLDGDGYITRVSISNGKAHFKSSFVRTPEYLAESEEGSVLFRSTFRTQRPPSVVNLFGNEVRVRVRIKVKVRPSFYSRGFCPFVLYNLLS